MSRLDDQRAKAMNDPVRAARIAGFRRQNEQAITLEQLRTGKKVTQTAIAQTLHVTQRRVSAIERQGNVLLDTLQQFVEALGYDLELNAVSKDGSERIRLQLPALTKTS